MPSTKQSIQVTSTKLHRKLAASLFNKTWNLMVKNKRTILENDDMVHAAHASRYHWGIVGKPVNFARGEWQISRVYSILKRSEPASYHAKRCLQICKENKIGDFDLAYAYEALARVSKINHSRSDQAKYYDKSLKASDNIRDSQDRALLLKDLRNLKPHR